jgi:hypothetical protein
MKRFRLLGFLPLAFFLAQAINYWHINELGHTLWMCNIGNLLLAVGLFLEKPIFIRVAAIWMVPGLAVWFVYVVPTWGMLLTGQAGLRQLFGVLSSTLAHLGGFSVGMLALRRVRMDGRAWAYAFGWYFVMQLLSRLITPVSLNINVSQKIQGGWEQAFSAYWKFWLVLTLVVGAVMWVLASILKLAWPVESHARGASTEPL